MITLPMVLLGIYLVVFAIIGIIDYFRIKGFDDFVVAGRKQSESFVSMSILCTIVGASATMGIASLAVQHGFVAYLWLGTGGVGLILQSIFLSKRIRALNAYTLPDLAGMVAGKEAKTIIAFVIAISWIGIIAAQFVALSTIVALLVGTQITTTLIVICSMAVIFYTIFGGQITIIRTDVIQLTFIVISIGIAIFAAFRGGDITLTNVFEYRGTSSISFVKVLHLIFIVGSTYFIGPDIFSRVFTAKSEIVAKKATFKAGLGLLVIGFAITLVGVLAALSNPSGGVNPFVFIIQNLTSPILGAIIALGLLSAIVSSADTCMLTVASIVEKDILGKARLHVARLMVLVIGVASLMLALFRTDILSLLTGTFSVFSPGVIFPVFVAIMTYGKFSINKKIWLSAVITGGALGILSNITGEEYISLVGMAFSIVLSLLSINKK